MKRAVSLIHNARNNYGAWRYELEPNGSSDTSITGWMIFALKTAEENQIPVDKAAYADAAGALSLTTPIPGSICGKTLQAVDMSACAATNTVIL